MNQTVLIVILAFVAAIEAVRGVNELAEEGKGFGSKFVYLFFMVGTVLGASLVIVTYFKSKGLPVMVW